VSPVFLPEPKVGDRVVVSMDTPFLDGRTGTVTARYGDEFVVCDRGLCFNFRAYELRLA